MREGIGRYMGLRTDNNEWVIGSLIKCGISGKCYILSEGSDANESQNVGQDTEFWKAWEQYIDLKTQDDIELGQAVRTAFEKSKEDENTTSIAINACVYCGGMDITWAERIVDCEAGLLDWYREQKEREHND